MDPDGSAGDVPRLSWDRSRAMGGRRAGDAQGGGTFLHQPEFSCCRNPTPKILLSTPGSLCLLDCGPGPREAQLGLEKSLLGSVLLLPRVGHFWEVTSVTLSRSGETWPGLDHHSFLGQNTHSSESFRTGLWRVLAEGQLIIGCILTQLMLSLPKAHLGLRHFQNSTSDC